MHYIPFKPKLDLVNPENSDFKYKVSSFPDGQHNITIDTNNLLSVMDGDRVTIVSRFNNFIDLEILTCAVYALRHLGLERLELYCPYILGARSDRMFSEGSTRYLKDIVAPVINNLNFSKVTVIDPHSDVMENVIENFNKKTNHDLVHFAIKHIYGDNPYGDNPPTNLVLVSPDAGALKKIYAVAESINYKQDIVIASKHRDIASGKITHTEVPGLDNFSPSSDFMIVDDLCDGGRTFIELAKVIRSHVWPHDEHFKGSIYLVVTHGIFSAGFTELSEHLDGIFCTNSYSNLEGTFDVPDQSIKRDKGIKVAHISDLVKQLNVF